MDTTNDAATHLRDEADDAVTVEEFDLEGALDALPQLDPAEASGPAEAVAEHLTRLLHGKTPGDGVTAT